MNPDDIDRILVRDVAITPSPAFVASVMRAVERESTARPSLAFPWKRALPGFLALAAGVMGGSISAAHDVTTMRILEEQLARMSTVVVATQLHWVALALLITAVSLVSASRMVRGKHYA